MGGYRMPSSHIVITNLSPGCLSQRIMFKLGPLWVVYIKVKCGAADEGRTEPKTKW